MTAERKNVSVPCPLLELLTKLQFGLPFFRWNYVYPRVVETRYRRLVISWNASLTYAGGL